MSMEGLRAWLEEQFAPVVLVAATPAAEAICAGQNGLSIVDLLRTQSIVSGLNGARNAGQSACRPAARRHLNRMQPPHGAACGAGTPHPPPCPPFKPLERAVPMRLGEFSPRIQELRLRFHAYSSVFQPQPEVRPLNRLPTPCAPLSSLSPANWPLACSMRLHTVCFWRVLHQHHRPVRPTPAALRWISSGRPPLCSCPPCNLSLRTKRLRSPLITPLFTASTMTR